jgi:hypothetical protein
VTEATQRTDQFAHVHRLAVVGADAMVVEHVAVQLALGIGVLVDAVQILAHRHELQCEGRPDDATTSAPGAWPAHGGIANAEPVQLAAGGRGTDVGQCCHERRIRAIDVGRLEHHDPPWRNAPQLAAGAPHCADYTPVVGWAQRRGTPPAACGGPVWPFVASSSTLTG